uniref:RING-type domain-containing protein n=1 Tax=Plectus sambesii TaxID=2011161 RepID=A0A914X2E9_9BILA
MPRFQPSTFGRFGLLYPTNLGYPIDDETNLNGVQVLDDVGHSDLANQSSVHSEQSEYGHETENDPNIANSNKTKRNKHGKRSYECVGKKRNRQQMRKIAKNRKSIGANAVLNTIEMTHLNAEPEMCSIETAGERQEVVADCNPIALSSQCIQCNGKSNLLLTCKHYVCLKCEVKKQWVAHDQSCDNCSELIQFKQKHAQLKKRLKKSVYLPQLVKPIDQVSPEVIRERCSKLHTVVTKLGGRESADGEVVQSAALVSEYLKRNGAFVDKIRKSKLPGLERRLTPREDLALCSDMHMTGRQRRKYISEMHKKGMNHMASTHAYNTEKKRLEIKTKLVYS